MQSENWKKYGIDLFKNNIDNSFNREQLWDKYLDQNNAECDMMDNDFQEKNWGEEYLNDIEEDNDWGNEFFDNEDMDCMEPFKNKKITVRNNIDTSNQMWSLLLLSSKCISEETIKDPINEFLINTFTTPKILNAVSGKSLEKLSSQNNFQILRNSDLINKLYLRFKLKDNFDREEIQNILDLLSESSIELQIGGGCIMKIEKLLYNFILCEKFGITIDKFEPSKFYAQYSNKELTELSFKTFSDKVYVTQKYISEDIDDVYLDIPLLFDKFGYDEPIKLIAIQYHDVRILFNNVDDKLNQYIEKTHLISDEIIYLDSDMRRRTAQLSHEILSLTPKTFSYQNYIDSELIITDFIYNAKFIFILIKHSECNDYSCSEQLPCIYNINFEMENGEIIDMINTDYTNYGNYRLYIISPSQNCNIHKWQNFQNENMNNIDDPEYKIEHIAKIHIILEKYENPIDIQIMGMAQNILRVMSGMAGLAFDL